MRAWVLSETEDLPQREFLAASGGAQAAHVGIVALARVTPQLLHMAVTVILQHSPGMRSSCRPGPHTCGATPNAKMLILPLPLKLTRIIHPVFDFSAFARLPVAFC